MRLIPSEGYMYLASPYTHPDPWVREMRYIWTMKELTRLLKEGAMVYSPIVLCHELAKIDSLPKAADFWEKFDFTMIEAAESFGILMLPGWRESLGIVRETKKANECRLRIIQIEPQIQITSLIWPGETA